MSDAADATTGDAPRRVVRLGWYAFTAVFALAFPIVGYRLDMVRLDAPISHETDRPMYNDALLILPMVRATLEGGSHWRTERLGFPGVQEMHDFPVIDHFHFLWLKVIGWCTGGAVLAFNLYYLLGYPLAALSMLAVLRQFGHGFPAAVACGLMFTALPYHQYRGESHYFLSAYYMVPPACMMMLWICRGRLPFFPLRDGRRRFSLRDKPTIAATIIALIVASAGAYYAFFACALLIVAGLFGWLSVGTWRALASAAAFVGIVFVAGLLNHLPTYLYHAQYGRHSAPVARQPEESEHYGMKIAQLILPIDDHKLKVFSEFKTIYNSNYRPVQAYTERYTLGLIASLGFVGLMATLLLPWGRRPPYLALATLTGFATALGVVGGLGAIFNQTITPSVRCYNRIAVYIAFFSLFAVATTGERIVTWASRHYSERTARRLPIVAWGGVLWLGLVDMTPYDWGWYSRGQFIQDCQNRWFQDGEFFGEIEATLNPEGRIPGPAVFELPYMAWPEAPPVQDMVSYEPVRGYLHSRTLRWSYGCMKGREVDEWYKSVAVMAPSAVPPMLDRVVRAGFEGLYLDKRGYTESVGDQVEAQLQQALAGAATIRHADGRQVFFDLRRYRDDVRSGRDWDAECYRETHRPTALWLDGFHSFAEPGYEWQRRWASPRATALFVNPSDETKTVTSTFRFFTELEEPSTLTIEGGTIWSEVLTIDKNSPRIARTFVIPPGRHTIRFRCEPPPKHIHTNPWRLLYLISGFKFD